ncbi:MAG TPA: EthD domain-containing protein [Sphingomicrobium sp.]|nr:EthD domain-containing protein [Sphingomicrobium sp.]
MIVLMKRKPGLSREEFREHYEGVHAVLGHKYFEGLLLDFVRYYPTDLAPFPSQWNSFVPSTDDADSYDAIAVYTFRDEEAISEYARRMEDPEISRTMREDEDRFLDRSGCRYGFCEVSQGQGILAS